MAEFTFRILADKPSRLFQTKFLPERTESVSDHIGEIERESLLRHAEVFCNIGTAVGRFGVSALLAVGMLAPAWTLRDMTVTRFQSIFLADAAIMAFSLVLLVLFPAFVPKHDDYYEPPAQPNA